MRKKIPPCTLRHRSATSVNTALRDCSFHKKFEILVACSPVSCHAALGLHLCHACVPELVKALVRHGCSVQIVNWTGETAREVAQDAGHIEVAEFLDGHEHRVLSRDVACESIDLEQKIAPPGEFRTRWTCPGCSASVYAKNNECFKCREPKPASAVAAEEEAGMDGVSPFAKNLLYQVRELQDGTPNPQD